MWAFENPDLLFRDTIFEKKNKTEDYIPLDHISLVSPSSPRNKVICTHTLEKPIS